jgi:23S rRNA (cytosine1962-C5)-methyltransferase
VWPSNSWLPASCLKSKRLHIRLRAAAEAQVRAGHPWVFSESIREQSRDAIAGELAIIFDKKNQFLALGLFDPDSPIRVRIIHHGKPMEIDGGFWRARLNAARERRSGIFDSETSAGRWIHGESDQFPGLVLDRYADTLVLKLYSGIWFSRLQEMTCLFAAEFRPERIVLRLSRNIQAIAAAQGIKDPSILSGTEPRGPIIFLESGLHFEADVLRGQKTGFFLDQRENRRVVGSLCAGREVLNAFSFSGGFSLYGARGGARSVTDIDISAHALESCRRNFALNPDAVRNCPHDLIQADVFEWLQQDRREKYDVVLLDPPSLAKRAGDRAASLKAYATLAGSGVGLVRPGGLVVSCSCSAHVRAAEFFETVEESARRSGRKVTVLQTTRQPPDHPATFPEAEYLKAMYLRVG